MHALLGSIHGDDAEAPFTEADGKRCPCQQSRRGVGAFLLNPEPNTCLWAVFDMDSLC